MLTSDVVGCRSIAGGDFQLPTDFGNKKAGYQQKARFDIVRKHATWAFAYPGFTG
jgi:hypothetical protein